MTAPVMLRAALLAAVACSLSRGIAAAQEAESLNPIKAIDRATLDNFVQRPLFDPARQLPPPPPPVVVNAAPPPPPPPEPPPVLQLLGVVHGRRDLAIVHKDGSEKTVVLRSGDKLGNWTVLVRPPVSVSLRNGDRKVDFAIFAKVGPSGGGGQNAVPARPFAVSRRHSRDAE